MNLRKNIILVVVFSCLGAWYYFYEMVGGERRELEKVESKRLLPGVSSNEIQEIEIRRITRVPEGVSVNPEQIGGYLLQFTKIDGMWGLTQPVKAPCHQASFQALLKHVTNISKGRIVDESPESYKAFGLDFPAFKLKISTENNNLLLSLGDENPTGDSFYMLVDNQPEVFLLDISLKEFLVKSVNYYRDKRIAPVSVSDITEVVIRSGPQSETVTAMKSEGNWILKKPFEAPADQVRFKELFKLITSQKVKDFIDRPDDLLYFGLNPPVMSLQLKTPDKTFNVALGTDADPGGKTRYAKSDTQDAVLIIEKELSDILGNEPFYFRAKEVCSLGNSLIKKISIHGKDGPVELIRDEHQNWLLVKPEQHDADDSAVSDYLSELEYFRATGIRRGNNSIGKQSATIKLTGQDDKIVERMVFGDVPEDGVGRWLRTANSNVVFRVSEADYMKVVSGPDRFMDRHLLNFNRNNLKMLRVEVSDKSIEIVPAGDTFKFTGDTDNISQDALESIYWSLHNLKSVKSLKNYPSKPTESQLTPFGLNKPALKITAITDSGESTTLLLGSQDENSDKLFAMKQFGNSIHLVDSFRFDEVFAAFSQ